MKVALTIAGSDSGGGAGIQADIKTIQAHGVFAASVVTAVTAQNTVEVRDAFEIPLETIRAQIDAVFDDFPIDAAKTGMLSSAPVIETVAAALDERGFRNFVLDPVMISKSGFRLLADDAVGSLKERLLPAARIVTPNLHEAALLTGMDIASLDEMKEAAARIHEFGPDAVVVKGGHADFSRGTDVLYDGIRHEVLEADVVSGRSVHGTGCTFSAAIAARLALGESVSDAVASAKTYVTRVIQAAIRIGRGSPPGNHFYFIGPSDFLREKK